MTARRIALVLAAAIAASSAARAETPPARRATTSATKPAAKRRATATAPAATSQEPAPARVPAVTPAATPAAVTLAAPLPAAPPPAAPAAFAPLPPGRTLTGAAWRGALLVGPELYDGATALKLRADLETDVLPLSPRAMLSGVVVLGFGRWSEDETVGALGAQVRTEASTSTFELVPSLRTSVRVGRKISIHADAGLGIFHARTEVETSATIPGASVSGEGSASTTGAVLRFGIGGHVDVSERVRLGAEALGLNFHLAEGGATSVSILAGAAYRF